MQKAFSIALLGLASAGFTLATPAESQARDFHFRIGGFGDSCGFGGGYGGGFYGGGLGFSDYGYRSSRFYDSGFGFGDFGYRSYGRGVIVHPETYHYSPFSGFHSHGHIHYPHRGHYHTIPY